MSGKYYDLIDGSLRSYYPDTKSKRSKTGPGPLVDAEVWFADNRPSGSVEQTNLRGALYYQRTHGSFVIEKWPKGAFTVKGRASTLLVESDATCQLLLRLL